MRPPVTAPRTSQRNAGNFGARIAGIESARGLFALLAALAILVLPVYAHAESQAAANTARSSIDFRIVVPAIVRVKAIAQPDQLLVTEADLARGYVDIAAGSSVILTTNSRMGYLLTATFDQRLLSTIEVRAANRYLQASSGTGSWHMASDYAVDRIVPIQYRLHLAAGVRAGTYPWPVSLQFSLSAV
jgi:hypothetical protein